MSYFKTTSNTWTQANLENEVRYAFGLRQWSGYVRYEYKAFDLLDKATVVLYRQDEAPVCFLKARVTDYIIHARQYWREVLGDQTKPQGNETQDKKEGNDEPPKHGYQFGYPRSGDSQGDSQSAETHLR